MALTARDSDWLKQSFMVAKSNIHPTAARARTFSSSAFKFTDTRLGGNFAINNPPGYTNYADIPVTGKYLAHVGRNSSSGMGRFYSEQLDDNSQLVHMRFGVPAFNGIVSFFTGFFDGQASYTARTGRSPGIFYRLGQLGGFVVALPYWPYIVTLSAGGRVLKFLTGIPSSKYYYLKPTAHMYWSRVNLIANNIAVNMRLVPPVYDPGNDFDFQDGGQVDPASSDGAGKTPTKAQIAAFHAVAPDIWREDGGIDVYQVANRAQRLANKQRKYLMQQLEEVGTLDDLLDRLDKYRTEYTLGDGGAIEIPTLMPTDRDAGDPESGKRGTEGLLERELSNTGTGYQPGDMSADSKSLDAVVEQSMRGSAKADEQGNLIVEPPQGFFANAWDNMKADYYDGSQFVTFRVDYNGAVSESFTSSTKESEISSKLNGFSNSSRSARFSFSDGQTGLAPVDAVFGAVRDVVGGALDMVNLSGLIGLFGSSFVDIPKQWDTSSAEFPRSDFTMELRSPYGHDMARFQNLMIPLACILAGALPLSTGKQSYTSPFLCEMYYRGRTQVRLGIIDNLTITRGVGNVGWTPDGKPLGIDVTFSVLDLSSVMHAPVSTGGLLNPINNIFADDSAFTDYMATLSSLSMADQIYQSRKMFLNMTRYLTDLDSYYSVGNFTSWMMDTWPARGVSAIAAAGARGQ